MFSAEKAISGSKILVVDDVETNRMILEEIIKDMGCRPILAESGVEALKLFYEFKPSLVLTDISMPQMDGYELCRVLKADPNSREIPVIFISAFDDPKDIVKGFSIGGIDYITKPFIPEVVLMWGIYGMVTAKKDGDADSINQAMMKCIFGAVFLCMPGILKALKIIV